MPDYIPRVLANLIAWFQNWATKIAVHGPSVGVTAAEIAAAADHALAVEHVVNGMQVRQTDAQAFSEFKNQVLFGIPAAASFGVEPVAPTPGTITPALPATIPQNVIGITRNLAQRMKSHTNYTPAMGEDLGIVAAVGALPDPKPTIKATPETGFVVRLGFAMRGFAMIEIQCKRPGDADFVTIGFDTAEPFLDSRAPVVAGQPEVRQYRARYNDGTGPIGDWSDIVSVTAQA